MGDFWVFGYGSLMWRPGFAHVETRRACLSGYRRTLCLRSHIHRGTPERPGLVLGLEPGGSCLGMAFRVASELSDEVLTYLRERELVTRAYHEKRLKVQLDCGETVEALTYVVDRKHQQYMGELADDEIVQMVSGAAGQSGRNDDYVLNTIRHLQALGIRDRRLENIARLLTGEAPSLAPLATP